MKKLICSWLCCLLAVTCFAKYENPSDTASTVASCRKCIVVAEQSQHRIVIVNVTTGAMIWEWKPELSNIQPAHVKWFSNPSDAKVVYNNQYILTNASGGGVALIRIADRKTVFYAYAGGNTHSVELLPDGNIVSASSTGNYLMLFRTDTLRYPDGVYTKKIPVAFGHNVVWDATGKRLWTAAMDTMHVFRYNFNCQAPDLTQEAAVAIPGTEAHDLFPVYRKNSLWLTNTTNVYTFDIKTRKTSQAPVLQHDIKSVSSGPAGYPVLLVKPKESWWTDEVIDAGGHTVFSQKGWKIYKARWVLPNTFSYPAGDQLHFCR
ncbi:hypothetical protein HGH93_10905 [Chitinophaga polysaccharea]|uniref:DUF6528 family protein n=1 Tax=Chitinophaga polysaccharea TaxID=1293035 RepID=UPI0014554AE9|nr:DUF6528 family protein [Chitinophaga polysaccharea]NLR58613.1 hypothetical protein [Chitinophaga polysaccharea]